MNKTIYIPDRNLWIRFALLAGTKNRSVSSVICELISKWIEENSFDTQHE